MSVDSLIRNTADSAFVLDPLEDRFVAASPPGWTMLGYSRAELLETPVSRIHPGELPQLQDLVARVLRIGRCTTITLTCRTRAGTFLPTEMALHAFATDRRLYILALVRDRSEHRSRSARKQSSSRCASLPRFRSRRP